jgi:hypothetical protein
MHRAVLIAIAVVSGGCATPGAHPRPTSQPLPASTTLAAHAIECHTERATGSLIAATVCTSAQQRARQADDAQQTKDWMNNVKAGGCPPNVQCN